MRTPERSADGSVGAAAIRTELSAADAATPSIAMVAANLITSLIVVTCEVCECELRGVNGSLAAVRDTFATPERFWRFLNSM